jgi:Protein of unknown function (DUF3551)
MKSMKVTCMLTLAFAAATMALLADTAHAQTLTWCALLDGDEQQCSYYTQQECLETVSGVGGVCILNPAAGSQQSTQPPQYPSSENAQGLLPLQLQNPGPPPN